MSIVYIEDQSDGFLFSLVFLVLVARLFWTFITSVSSKLSPVDDACGLSP